MRWCRFQNKDAASFGIIEGDDVIAVDGSPFEQYQRMDKRYPLSAVKLLVPVIPPTFYAAGLNYREHVIESAAKRGEEPKFPPNADIGYRANNALVANGEAIVIPKDASEVVQYEGELVAVIGRGGRHIDKSRALDHVAGWSIFNDVSVRDYQFKTTQWTMGKNFDATGPFGPCLVTVGLGIQTRSRRDRRGACRLFAMALRVGAAGRKAALVLRPAPIAYWGTRTRPLWPRSLNVRMAFAAQRPASPVRLSATHAPPNPAPVSLAP